MLKKCGNGEDKMPILLIIKVKNDLVVVKETSTTHSMLLTKQTIVVQKTIVQALHLNSQFLMSVAKNL
jgi:hypothetical protein